jgi:hypothetical protein
VVNKPKVSRAEKEADSISSESIARYQLMFAAVENEADPNNPAGTLIIQVVKFPAEITREMKKIIDTSIIKLSDAAVP